MRFGILCTLFWIFATQFTFSVMQESWIMFFSYQTEPYCTICKQDVFRFEVGILCTLFSIYFLQHSWIFQFCKKVCIMFFQFIKQNVTAQFVLKRVVLCITSALATHFTDHSIGDYNVVQLPASLYPITCPN